MKILKAVFILTFLLVSVKGFAQDPHTEGGLTKGIVQEVLQVSSYTYLNLLVGDEKKWVAVPTMEANLGEVFYYRGGMEMPNFESTELGRTFDTVLFLTGITNADIIDSETGKVNVETFTEDTHSKQPTLDKLDLDIPGIEDGIRIAELFNNKEDYSGKKVRVRGEVTKFSGGIMGKNWVHFQDGTEFEGKYDLMITTQENVSVGDIITFEGVIAIDKDFGGGYFYNVILENAVKVE